MELAGKPPVPASRVESGSGRSTDRQGASRFRRDGPNDGPQPVLAAAFCLLSFTSELFSMNPCFVRMENVQIRCSN